jgi:hypothetical protein
MKLDKFNAEDWLGNRGLLEDNFYKDSAMSKLRRHKVRGDWLFIQSDGGWGDVEVEAYQLSNMYGECYDAWPSKGFSWSAANLAKKVEGLEA